MKNPTQNEDGKAHIAYYYQPYPGYSFVWDGESATIEVSVGGYGEPVDHMLPLDFKRFPINWRQLSIRQVLRMFEVLCFNHAVELQRGRVE